MQRTRRVVAASVSVSMALAGSIAIAHADGTSVLYVSNSSPSCTDTGGGAGSAATPFCTIQAGADAATAGDTVEISGGKYTGPLNVTSVGTAAAPIVFQAMLTSTGAAPAVIIENPVHQTGPAVTFDGASYVKFEGRWGNPNTEGNNLMLDGVLITGGSSHITLDSIIAAGLADGVEVAGASSDVTVTRSAASGASAGILVAPGSSGAVISTNQVTSGTVGIGVEDSANTAVTSNTVWGNLAPLGPLSLIGVSAGSTGTTIENNIVDASYEPSDPPGISVDSTSAAGTTEDYNVESPWGPAYSWAGIAYSSQTAFTAATGQGKHDLLDNMTFDSPPYTDEVTAPQINSANGAASGMLSTDFYGYPCTIDPVVPVSGAGSPAFCARGAVQQRYSTTVGASAIPTGALSVDLDSAMSQTSPGGNTLIGIKPAPTPAVSYVVEWGDGTTSAPAPGSSTDVATTATHTYAKPGTYTITDTAELTDGSTTSTTASFTTAGSDYSAVNPARILDTRHGDGGPTAKVPVGGSITVKVAGVGSIPANATAVALNLTATDTTGDGFLSVGTASTSSVNYVKGQTVANSVIAPVTNGSITIYNSGTGGSADIVADVSGYFSQSAGDGYSAAPLERILNTRNGTGAPKADIPANSGVPVTIVGADSIPADVTAVALHVTVADTTGGGWIAAEPDGAGTPGTSSLNYGPGQIVSNTVIVPVAPDGKIELYNGGGATPVNLLADVAGYFSADAPDAYAPITPSRVVDTRVPPNSAVPGGATVPALLGGEEVGGPALGLPANATLVANTTVTDVKGNGYLTVYPAGTSRPSISNLNFAKGQTLAGLGFLATSGPDQETMVYNNSTGSIDLVVDVFGYFSNS